MSMTIFDSRDTKYKSPFGAVSCGTAVSFIVTPGPEYCACALVTYGEFAVIRGETALSPCPEGFTGTFTAPDTPELVWYTFRFTRTNGGSVYLGRNGLGGGDDRQPWQLTVYENRPTPEWFGQGVTYQIFPDRFCRDAIPDPKGLLGQRTVHDSWDDIPRLGADPLTGRWNSDFFGGSLRGICGKLDYLQSLSVTTIYLNPIFYAASCHRYDTADYRMVDPMLGTEDDLRTLCAEAKKRGIHVILDGVFNHTGDDSRYFNRCGFFDTPGAYQSKESPWYDWFCFQHWPDKYDAWWGIDTLPAVNENAPAYRDFIIRGEDSIIRHWLRCGADGWRLDVADELPDDFIHGIHAAARQAKPEAVIIGEVWEDGSNKIAYGVRRRHILGGHCDGLMNYPFRNALLSFLLGEDAFRFRQAMETLRENYPPFAWRSAMNFLGTHDTPRILTLLGTGGDGREHDKDWRAAFRMSPGQYALGKARLKLGALVLFAFPGSPMVYYGDEAGLEGFEDPFNRRTYPWGREDGELLEWYTALGKARRALPALRRGELAWTLTRGRVLSFLRTGAEGSVLAAVNAGDRPEPIDLPWPARDWMTGAALEQGEQTLPPMTGWLLTPRPEGA